MTSPAYVCEIRHLIYFPVLIWEVVSGRWAEQWRAGLWSLAEARRVHAELGRQIEVLEALERERQERVTRAEGEQVKVAA